MRTSQCRANLDYQRACHYKFYANNYNYLHDFYAKAYNPYILAFITFFYYCIKDNLFDLSDNFYFKIVFFFCNYFFYKIFFYNFEFN